MDGVIDFNNIEKYKQFSASKVAELRGELRQALESSKYADRITVVATGSYGRQQASEQSDLDYYLLFDANVPASEAIPDEMQHIANIVKQTVPHGTGDTGIFGANAVVHFGEMLENIGGLNDTNQLMTRRMLFLLEGDWLFNEGKFKEYQSLLLRKYLREDARSDSVPLFLLNDIIRYYRTILTDFEHKVTAQGKSWGVRNIKLRFSRKLLYFGGIIVAAEMVGKQHQQRLEEASRLFSLPVIDRMKEIGGVQQAQEILKIYDSFLADMADENIRQKLDQIEHRKSRWDSDEYRRLRKQGYDFSKALATWLQHQYGGDHPIHQALVF